jgi:hypothetical protein
MNPLNRRSLFGFLAAAPVAIPIAAKAMALEAPVAQAALAAVETPKYTMPLGMIIDSVENFAAPCHHHGYSNLSYSQACVHSRFVHKIYDGQRFVLLDSPEGDAVRARVRG